MKEFILILGMHRSGTSLTANLIHKLGFYIGKNSELLGKNKFNEKGHYEYKPAVDLNDRIFLENGMIWESIRKVPVDLLVTKRLTDISLLIQKLMNDSGLASICLKDPRMCILEPLWMKEIKKQGIKERCVVVFRHPQEVAASLQSRTNMDFWYALCLWYYYNCSILNILLEMDVEDYIILNHNDYFTNGKEQITRLARFLHAEDKTNNIEGIIEQKLWHNQVHLKETFGMLGDMVSELYEYYVQLSNGKDTIKQSIVDKYTGYLEKMVDDICKVNIGENIVDSTYALKTISVKEWANNILCYRTDEVLSVLDRYFRSHQIQSVALYGNGTTARLLGILLLQLGIQISNIYDKTGKGIAIFGDTKILVNSLPVREEIQKQYVINTIVKNDSQVCESLYRYFPQKLVISLYSVLCSVVLDV